MVYGVGYCSKNDSEYSKTSSKCYLTWRNMLKRCYSNELKYANYKEQNISVCDEWLDFSIFKKWFDRNYYETASGEEMNLDKDILHHGNKMYCPEYCVFVPKAINQLFVRSSNRRGNLPIGVCKNGNRFTANCSMYGRNIKKTVSTSLQAFEEYKEMKEYYVKEVAKTYKNIIPDNLYNALMMFEVKITD